MNIYVGNLSREVTDQDLQDAFSAYGQVKSVKVIRDHDSGESKGFGFVDMPQNTEAQAAIQKLNEKMLKGRKINVNEARPKTNDGNRRGSNNFNNNFNKPRNNSGNSGNNERSFRRW
ncbi:MAG: RNA recognition motif domain-containing protein [Bacillota bacterium]